MLSIILFLSLISVTVFVPLSLRMYVDFLHFEVS